MTKEFYNGKRVFVTGHTGFKGSYLIEMLSSLGAKVCGYALKPEEKSIYNALKTDIESVYGDIRDYDLLENSVRTFAPDIILHLAAQPLVLDSYENPRYTYDVNVMGTVNILECARNSKSVKCLVNVTTDKVYKNREWIHGYRENDELNGYDPYSNSKSCSDIVTDSYRKSFFSDKSIAVSTARAGNVIGAGDFSKNRIIPDCVQAQKEGKRLMLRNGSSVRPYQHVLDCLCGYLELAERSYKDNGLQGAYNFGPDIESCVTTKDLATLFAKSVCARGKKFEFDCAPVNKNAPHEANFLRLDASKARQLLNWSPKYDIAQAVDLTVDAALVPYDKLADAVRKQIQGYLFGGK